MQEFELGADDGSIGESDGEDTAYEVGEGGNTVHENPKAWQGSRTDKNTK